MIRLDRPRVRNALNLELIAALDRILQTAENDTDVAVLVLSTTDPTAFCAGMDTDEPRLTGSSGASAAITALTWTLASYPKPVVGVLPGYVIGGGAELALTADVRIGDPSTRFRFPGTAYGLAQGSWHLVDAVGQSWAKQLVLTGRFVEAEESLRLGLVHELSADPEQRGLEVAHELTQRSPRAMAESKRLIGEASGTPWRRRFDAEALVNDQLMDEHEVIGRLRSRADPGTAAAPADQPSSPSTTRGL